MNEGLLNFVLVLAAIFFVTNTLMFVVLLMGLVKLRNSIDELKPRVNQLATKVEASIDKLDKVSERVNSISTSLHSTVDAVGARAKGLANTAGDFAQLASAPIEKYSPIIAGFFAVLKVVQTVQGLRRKKD